MSISTQLLFFILLGLLSGGRLLASMLALLVTVGGSVLLQMLGKVLAATFDFLATIQWDAVAWEMAEAVVLVCYTLSPVVVFLYREFGDVLQSLCSRIQAQCAPISASNPLDNPTNDHAPWIRASSQGIAAQLAPGLPQTLPPPERKLICWRPDPSTLPSFPPNVYACEGPPTVGGPLQKLICWTAGTISPSFEGKTINPVVEDFRISVSESVLFMPAQLKLIAWKTDTAQESPSSSVTHSHSLSSLLSLSPIAWRDQSDGFCDPFASPQSSHAGDDSVDVFIDPSFPASLNFVLPSLDTIEWDHHGSSLSPSVSVVDSLMPFCVHPDEPAQLYSAPPSTTMSPFNTHHTATVVAAYRLNHIATPFSQRYSWSLPASPTPEVDDCSHFDTKVKEQPTRLSPDLKPAASFTESEPFGAEHISYDSFKDDSLTRSASLASFCLLPRCLEWGVSLGYQSSPGSDTASNCQHCEESTFGNFAFSSTFSDSAHCDLLPPFELSFNTDECSSEHPSRGFIAMPIPCRSWHSPPSFIASDFPPCTSQTWLEGPAEGFRFDPFSLDSDEDLHLSAREPALTGISAFALDLDLGTPASESELDAKDLSRLAINLDFLVDDDALFEMTLAPEIPCATTVVVDSPTSPTPSPEEASSCSLLIAGLAPSIEVAAPILPVSSPSPSPVVPAQLYPGDPPPYVSPVLPTYEDLFPSAPLEIMLEEMLDALYYMPLRPPPPPYRRPLNSRLARLTPAVQVGPPTAWRFQAGDWVQVPV